MAGPFYVSSVTGDNSTGLGWTTAFTTMAACIAGGLTAGDTVYVASDHTETQGSAMTWTFPGTVASPNKILSSDRSATPPTALAFGAQAITTGAFSISVNGSAYIYGYDFRAGTGGTAAYLQFLPTDVGSLTLEACACKILTTNASSTITVGTTTLNKLQRVRWINTTATFGAVGQRIGMWGSEFIWQNTPSAILGTVPTTALFATGSSTRPAILTLDGVDFSALAAGTQIIPALAQIYLVNMTNCKMATSFSALAATPSGPGGRVMAMNCSDTTQNYRQQLVSYAGTLNADTTTYRTAGANDGTTSISWKVINNANANRYTPFRTFEIAKWNEVLTSQTVTVEVATDNVTLTNAECWIEVQVMDDASSTLTTLFSTQCGALATPANLTTSTAPWTGVPGTPVTQKITSPTFTADIKGDIRVAVFFAKASTTVYIDPEITVA